MSVNQCPNLAHEQKMDLPLINSLVSLLSLRWQAARRLKRRRGHALDSWVSIKDLASHIKKYTHTYIYIYECTVYYLLYNTLIIRTASSHGLNGVAWPGTRRGSESAAH